MLRINVAASVVGPSFDGCGGWLRNSNILQRSTTSTRYTIPPFVFGMLTSRLTTDHEHHLELVRSKVDDHRSVKLASDLLNGLETAVFPTIFT